MTASATVAAGPFTARLWQASDGRWKWHAYEGGKRVLRSAGDLATAKKRAAEHLRALRDGRAALLDADAATVSAFVAWRSATTTGVSVEDAAAKYLAALKGRGVTEIHRRVVEEDCLRFAKAHRGKLGAVTPEDVSGHLAGLGVSPRRSNNVRGALVAWFRWCRMAGMLPDATTAPERVAPQRLAVKPVAVYTPAEFVDLLRRAPKAWRVALAVGGLSGLRSEEIAGLRWEDMRLEKRLIEVRAEVSKTRRRRLVPINDSLAAWIEASKPQPGNMVAPRSAIDALSAQMRRHGFRWVRNGLRHSFGSYRCAVLKDVPAVAFEMGNSPAMVMAHYNEAQELADALKWFAVTPAVVRSWFDFKPAAREAA
jgi:integrase